MSKKKSDQYAKVKKIKAELSEYLDEVNKKRSFSVVLPNNLHRNDLIEGCPEDVDTTRWVEGCWFIVSSIINLQANKGSGKKNVPVTLNAQILKANVGGNYTKMVKFLTYSKVIVLVRKAIKGKSSRLYRLEDSYNIRSIKYRTLTDKGILKAQRTFHKELLENLKVKTN